VMECCLGGRAKLVNSHGVGKAAASKNFRVHAYTVQNARRNIQGASFFLEMVLIYFL